VVRIKKNVNKFFFTFMYYYKDQRNLVKTGITFVVFIRKFMAALD